MRFTRLSAALAAMSLAVVPAQAQEVEGEQTEVLGTKATWSVESDGDYCTIKSERGSERMFYYRTNMDFGYQIHLSSPTVNLHEGNQDEIMLKAGDVEIGIVRLFTLFGIVGDAKYFDVTDGEGNSERFSLEGMAEVKPLFSRCMNHLKGLKTTGPVPTLVSFDGGAELLQAASRAGILRQRLGFALKVSSEGKITECHLSRQFRKKFVHTSMCKVLTEHHSFEPAVNSEGEPVTGVYDGEVLMYSPFSA